ncbi:nucleoporin [Martiniozyma asiatica (nom. inval.)]|nr:nucleoporin [Martiniozyma asiatica]
MRFSYESVCDGTSSSDSDSENELDNIKYKQRLAWANELAASVRDRCTSSHNYSHSKISDNEKALKNSIKESEKIKTKIKSESIGNFNSEVGSLASYFTDLLTSRISSHRSTVDRILEDERLAIQKAKEEEARRKAQLEDEERQRQLKLAEERKRKEEEERKAKEAAEKAQREAEENARKAERELAERKLAEAKEKAEAEKRKTEEAKSKIFPVIRIDEIKAQFEKYTKEIQRIKEEINAPVKSDPNLKKLVSQQKRKINPKFGQLTNSQSQLTKITGEINQLLSEAKSLKLAYHWLLNFTAKAIVSQAETEVSLNSKMALPLAKLTLNLILLNPELLELLKARLIKKCPLIIGYTCDIKTEEGRKKMGWKRSSDGKFEDENRYTERLSGIMTLFAVMTRLKIDGTFVGVNFTQVKHPLPIFNSWTFLARMIDTNPILITPVHFAVVGAWWEACCVEFEMAYRRQAAKLLALATTKWILLGKGSAMERLKLLGEDWRVGKFTGLAKMDP